MVTVGKLDMDGVPVTNPASVDVIHRINQSKSRLLFVAICLLFSQLTGGVALAQVATGTISGIVSDPAGAVIPESTVVLTNSATGQVFTSTTNANGFYSFPALQPGQYQVEATKRGFDRTQTSLPLAVGQLIKMDLKLAVGPENVV